ncbi:MAG: hypothetical protein EGQ31_04075 [Prevotella sp.]|nr:hypothetical protein [Prevotella sp.]
MIMAMDREETWNKKYQALKAYVEEYKQFPDKKKVENRALLNWWKYNKKRMKQGAMTEDKQALLLELSNMRTVHK